MRNSILLAAASILIVGAMTLEAEWAKRDAAQAASILAASDAAMLKVDCVLDQFGSPYDALEIADLCEVSLDEVNILLEEDYDFQLESSDN